MKAKLKSHITYVNDGKDMMQLDFVIHIPKDLGLEILKQVYHNEVNISIK